MSIRFVVLRRKRFVPLLAALLSAAVFAAVQAPAAVTASAPARQLPIYCVARDQKVCAACTISSSRNMAANFAIYLRFRTE